MNNGPPPDGGLVPDGSVLVDLATTPAGCASRCPTGCCDTGGVCHSGLEDAACGAGGFECAACVGSTCAPRGDGAGGWCVAPDGRTCNPQTCRGCCQGLTCVMSESDDQACGTADGEACVVCAPDEHCKGGCVKVLDHCGPDNCPGCCAGPACYRGLSGKACGVGGEVCDECYPDGVCFPVGTGGKCTISHGDCLTQSCAGCCVGVICAVGSQDVACGSNGFTCVNCENLGKHCFGGACQ